MDNKKCKLKVQSDKFSVSIVTKMVKTRGYSIDYSKKHPSMIIKAKSDVFLGSSDYPSIMSLVQSMHIRCTRGVTFDHFDQTNLNKVSGKIKSLDIK